MDMTSVEVLVGAIAAINSFVIFYFMPRLAEDASDEVRRSARRRFYWAIAFCMVVSILIPLVFLEFTRPTI